MDLAERKSHKVRRWRLAVGIIATMICTILCPLGVSAEHILGEFNGSGFTYTWEGLQESIGNSAVRLTDPVDGWGGAGLEGNWQLGAERDGRLVVDVIAHPDNRVDRFGIELIDAAGNRGQWYFGTSLLSPGVTTQVVAQSPLSQPEFGVGDWRNLNLDQISTWQFLGEFNSTRPIDLSIDRVAVSTSIPDRPPYEGRELDAPWRLEAAERIDAIRKDDYHVRVVDRAGRPIFGAEVAVRMQEHEFGFGSAVQASRLQEGNPEQVVYQQHLERLFNRATLQSELQWPAWTGQWGDEFSPPVARAALDWLRAREIATRGHVLVWPAYEHLPQHVQAILDRGPLTADGQMQLRDALRTHIGDIVGTVGDAVFAWDVVNEPRTSRDVISALDEGDRALADWLTTAHAAAPHAQLFVNEYAIVASAGGTDTYQQRTLLETLQRLIDQSAPVHGVGIQGHFDRSTLTGPVQVWEILDRFAELGLAIHITEFDFDTTDEQLQADFTRDFLTAVFAHEGVDLFNMWGFWEGAHWRPDAALFRDDWSAKPNGQVFQDLVYNRWWTNADLTTTAEGLAAGRGFKGDYEVTVSMGDLQQSAQFKLVDGGTQLEIVLPITLATTDFNGDGRVDDADVQVVWSNWGRAGVGDINGDNVVDAADASILFMEWRSAGNLVTPIPEPNVLWVLFVGYAWGCRSLLDGPRRRRTETDGFRL